MVQAQREDQVLAGWAHDLGKPLLVIGRYARQLAEEAGPDPGSRALARSIVAMTDDALRVVDRLVENASPRSANRGLRDKLPDLLGRVGVHGYGLHPDRRLCIRGRLPDVEIDSGDLVFRILLNLVDNALRASARGDVVTLSARLDGPTLVIEVVDRGIGMSQQVRERAFEPYYSTRRSLRTAGLGLADCRMLVADLGGGLDLVSSPGRGTRACVRFPVGEAGIVCRVPGGEARRRD